MQLQGRQANFGEQVEVGAGAGLRRGWTQALDEYGVPEQEDVRKGLLLKTQAVLVERWWDGPSPVPGFPLPGHQGTNHRAEQNSKALFCTARVLSRCGLLCWGGR